MQVTSKEEIFKPYLCLFSGSKVVCLDNRFCVVSCEGSLLESGECVLKSVRETVPEPLGVVMDTTLYKNEHFYCLRLHPIKNGIGGNRRNDSVYRRDTGFRVGARHDGTHRGTVGYTAAL